MSYILNIHTSTEIAIVNLAKGDQILGTATNVDTRQHASFLHTAIASLLLKNNLDTRQLSAVGVSAGPGSYTGIRVGLSAAKGLCYALNIPLITFNSLELLALSSITRLKDEKALYCPMIDARRMEVFTALYSYSLQQILPPSAMILNENSFDDILISQKIFFSGSGIDKFMKLTKNSNSFFTNETVSSESLALISRKKFESKKFENIPYAQPLYIKDFHTISKA
jgi:tRNA threonylcarbamoyladenosine biosynthesis protein TsaB